jgi:hypothetical protein
MYKIGDLWINPAHIAYAHDDATTGRLALYLAASNVLIFEDQQRQQVLYMLEKETTTEIGA